ncbi:MAG: hypothetical protein WBC33_03245, partial [Conexibacter sp.]
MPTEHERQTEPFPPAPAVQEPASAEAASAATAGEQAAAAVEHDLDELVARAAKADEYLALAQRSQADFENFRKRMTRDVAAAEARGVGKL